MANSKFPSKSAQKKANKLNAQARELAFYNNLRTTPTAPQRSPGNKPVAAGKAPSSTHNPWTKSVQSPRGSIPKTELKVTQPSQRAQNESVRGDSSKEAEMSIDESISVANTKDGWTEVRHKKNRA